MILSGQLQPLLICIRSSLGQMYKCRAQHCGALLSLPHNGQHNDVIHRKAFKECIKVNVVRWFLWSKTMKLPVKHIEDLILITGCTLVTSQAAAVFDGHTSVDSCDMKISLEARKFNGGGTQIFWCNICGNVDYHNNHLDPVHFLDYVFSL